MLATLSLRNALGNSACVDPWQAEQYNPPCPLENRNSEWFAEGALLVVAKRRFTGSRNVPLVSENTLSKRIRPLFVTASPVWHAWQFGSSSQPVRLVAPTSAMPPWQSWHCMASVPLVATARPIAPRRQRVSPPGWQR